MVALLVIQYYYFDINDNSHYYPQFPMSQVLFFPIINNSITQNHFLERNVSSTVFQSDKEKFVCKLQEKQQNNDLQIHFSQNNQCEIISKKLKRKPFDFIDKQNIIPNNINHVLAFIRRQSKSGKILQKIIEKQKKQQHSYTIKGFYSNQSYIKSKLSVHVNTKALQIAATHFEPKNNIFSSEEQRFYNKVCRIAICYYLNVMAPLVTLNSRRLKNTCRKDHLKIQRFLRSVLGTFSINEQSSFGGKRSQQ